VCVISAYNYVDCSQLCDELDERKSGDDVEGVKKKGSSSTGSVIVISVCSNYLNF